MNRLLTVFFILFSLNSNAQDLFIQFRGNIESEALEKVIAENITQRIKLNVTNKQYLRLSDQSDLKPASSSEVVMPFKKNDKLRFTGIAGNFSTIIMDSPRQNKTFTFNFISCLDGEKKNYPIIQIGHQMWMAENIASRKLTDGTNIPIKFVASDYYDPEFEPALYAYNNSSSNYTTYGGLYDWDLVWTKKLCPEGWHVPSVNEWETLIDYLGGKNKAGKILKESGNNHWLIKNEETTDSVGFRALPGGINTNEIIQYKNLGYGGFFWTSDVNSQNLAYAYFVAIFDNDTPIQIGSHLKNTSSSVRCIYNNEMPAYKEMKDTILCDGEIFNSWDSAGQYTEKFTSVLGYDSVIVSNLTYYNSPNPEIVVSGDTLKSQYSYSNYNWFSTEEENPVSNQAEFIINESGRYYLQVIDEYGCEKTSEVLNLYQSSFDKKELYEFDYSVIPNPSNGIFEFRINSPVNENIILKLINSEGIILKEKTIKANSWKSFVPFSINNSNNGIYFLIIINGADRYTEKIIIN